MYDENDEKQRDGKLSFYAAIRHPIPRYLRNKYDKQSVGNKTM